MEYVCLRNCYVADRLWKEGKVYDLPDSMEKHPKNFQPLHPEPSPELPQPDSSPLTCSVCGKECKSALGLASHARSHEKEK